jgi:hypothetical protein
MSNQSTKQKNENGFPDFGKPFSFSLLKAALQV